MSNFIKVAIGIGAIGLISLVFVIFYTGKKDAQHEVEFLEHKKMVLQFDKDFAEGWNRGKASMSDSKEERDFWQDKAERDRSRLAELEKDLDSRLESAQRRFEGKARDSDEFTDDLKKTVKDFPETSDDAFKEKMLKKLQENR